MATSSITHNFFITDSENAQRFVQALDEAEKDQATRLPLPGKMLTDPEEIAKFMNKRKKK